ACRAQPCPRLLPTAPRPSAATGSRAAIRAVRSAHATRFQERCEMAKIETAQFADDGKFPNSRLPVILFREAIARDEAGPEALEDLFERNGWPPQWRSQVYTYDHYHSVSHEVLGIARG